MNQQGPPPKKQALDIKKIILHVKESDLKTKEEIYVSLEDIK